MRGPSINPAAKPKKIKPPSTAGKHTSAPKKKQPTKPRKETLVQPDDTPPTDPFGTSELALIDNEAAGERAADSIETLPELEREIGIADWIDPQTGEPAEGQSPPHLDEG